jgi:NAD(P)-dependent dehydrogenase (short-subunit alcohol dehydrogenase family)
MFRGPVIGTVAGALLYASTKGAIETLTRGLALELAPLGRFGRVTDIVPLASVPSIRRISLDHRRGHSAAGGLVLAT